MIKKILIISAASILVLISSGCFADEEAEPVTQPGPSALGPSEPPSQTGPLKSPTTN